MAKKRKKKHKKHKIHINLWTVAAIIIALAAMIALPYLGDRRTGEKGAKVPEGGYSYGIDISHFQPKVQWDSLMVLTDGSGRTIRSMKYAKDIKPVSYVFVKATEGNSMKDKNFRNHWTEAGKRSIRRGAYHFFRSSKDPVQQAESFISTVGELRYKDLPPVLDIETIHPGCSHESLNKKALIWLKTVEKHYGRRPIVYSSASFIEDILCKEIKENYPIWVAHYGTERPKCSRWHIWQFTDKAVVHGVSGHVDLNACRTTTLDEL